LILWNATASSITADDFVLVDSSYATSSLSGVTISTSTSDAGFTPENGELRLDGEGSETLPQSSGSNNINIENPDKILDSLIDENDGLNFDNLDINTNNQTSEISDLKETLELDKVEAPVHEKYDSYSIVDELAEEELLFFVDSI
jgi:hypothetical protein